MSESVAGALARGRATLAGVPDPMREARTLLAHAAGLDRGELHRLDDGIGREVVARYDALCRARGKGRPLSRLLGYRDFWTARFAITDDTLDPRAETETLVAAALARPWTRCLDLGTGSGCILLSLLGARERAAGIGTDTSAAALDVAAGNAAALGLAGRADFLRSDWFERVEGAFDLIVSNPPYIAAAEMDALSPEVRDHDPAMSLTDGADGLEAYRAIVVSAPGYLVPGGCLMVEIGWRQREAVVALFDRAGFRDVACHEDLEGRDRVVSGNFE